MKTMLKFLLAAGLLICSVTGRVDACSCEMRPPPCYDYWKMDAVFIGTIDKVRGNPDYPMGIEDKVEVKVERNYRGMDFDNAFTYNAGHSCAFHFKTGDKFLFYAGLDSKDRRVFGVNFCTRTARLNEKLIDFDFLDRLVGKPPVFWIWATVSTHLSSGLEGIRATATREGFAVSSVSDPNGDLKLVVPGEGKYKVRIHLPKDKTYSGLLRSDQSLQEEQRKIVRRIKPDGKNRYVDYEVGVAPNKCAWIDLNLMDSE